MGVDFQTGLFSLRKIKAATKNFDISFKIGEGGFGPVYKMARTKRIWIEAELVDKAKDLCCGYMAPEYAMHGYLTDKADVYSFGIVALEIVSGKSNNMNCSKEGCFSLIDLVHLLKRQSDLMDLVDERLGKDFRKDEVVVMINVALLCTQVSPMRRPTMASVVCMLEGKTNVPEVVLDTSEVLDGKKLEMQQYYRMREKNITHETQEESISMGETSTFMSSINMDSSFQEKSH
ncbi:hypothetical protein VNO80_27003 [Phaseolus coccineus]|uniref:Serine-threonine/tyrosine-protein kinase catalytic domain-containing protein n=1 Tax=Phaseolus coccineus TaxID=3886 RepID=A0AAN9QHN5_PHACN